MGERLSAQPARVLVVDDAPIWLKQGGRVLREAGYVVEELLVTDASAFDRDELPPELLGALGRADVLLCDKDLGLGVTSDRLLCRVRAAFPALPIVRWTGGYERDEWMKLLGVSTIGKPTRGEEARWLASFAQQLAEQRLILGGPSAVLAAIAQRPACEEGGDERDGDRRLHRLQQLTQIAGLADADRVPVLDEDGSHEYDRYSGQYRYWALAGRDGGVTKHEFGHAVCDGQLTADDIRPILPMLQVVVRKLRELGEVDGRFQVCADFITAGDLDELELVRGCY